MTPVTQIDQLLTTLHSGEYYQLFNESSQAEYQTVNKALAYKLISEDGDTYNLTERGYEVINAGGFEQWKAIHEQRQNEAHQATLDSARATVDAAKSAKLSKYAAYVSAISAILAFAMPFLPSRDTDRVARQDSTINAIREKVDTVYSRWKAQSQSQTPTGAPLQIQRKK